MPDIDLHRGEDFRGVIISLSALFPTFSNRTRGGRSNHEKAQGIEEGAIKSLLDTGAETGGERHKQNRTIKRGIIPEGVHFL